MVLWKSVCMAMAVLLLADGNVQSIGMMVSKQGFETGTVASSLKLLLSSAGRASRITTCCPVIVILIALFAFWYHWGDDSLKIVSCCTTYQPALPFSSNQ